MIYGSIRVRTGPCGPIFVARGEKSQVEKVKINISDRDFFLGLVQGIRCTVDNFRGWDLDQAAKGRGGSTEGRRAAPPQRGPEGPPTG